MIKQMKCQLAKLVTDIHEEFLPPIREQEELTNEDDQEEQDHEPEAPIQSTTTTPAQTLPTTQPPPSQQAPIQATTGPSTQEVNPVPLPSVLVASTSVAVDDFQIMPCKQDGEWLKYSEEYFKMMIVPAHQIPEVLEKVFKALNPCRSLGQLHLLNQTLIPLRYKMRPLAREETWSGAELVEFWRQVPIEYKELVAYMWAVGQLKINPTPAVDVVMGCPSFYIGSYLYRMIVTMRGSWQRYESIDNDTHWELPKFQPPERVSGTSAYMNRPLYVEAWR